MGVLGEGEESMRIQTRLTIFGGDRNPINYQWTTRWIGMLRLPPLGYMQLATFPGNL